MTVMSPTSLLMIAIAAVTALAALNPRVLRSKRWRATVTPLASIIGSGFLVVVPILAHAAGNWAWLAMTALCAAAYMFGAVVRHNIAVVEPLLENGAPRSLRLLEGFSNLALTFAYFVSVAYYLNLFAAFGLRSFDITDPAWVRIASTGVIALIGLVGIVRGLGGLEMLEEGAVGIKLGLIAGLLAAMALTSALALGSGTLSLPVLDHATGSREVAILLGLLILVQGFETSRYLGEAYDRKMRIETMRSAQIISTVIYIAFVFLATPFFTADAPASGGETAIIDLLAPLGMAVAPLIIMTALASQLSAAVADLNGAGGLIVSASAGRVAMAVGYALTAAAAIAITWIANIYEIIAYASKAFVLYYGLQSIVALVTMSHTGGWRQALKSGLFGFAVLVSIAVLIFGIPADA